MKRPKKYEEKLFIDMPFGEALERFGGVKPEEMQANIEKTKRKKKAPGNRGGSSPGDTIQNDARVVRLGDRRKRHG